MSVEELGSARRSLDLAERAEGSSVEEAYNFRHAEVAAAIAQADALERIASALERVQHRGAILTQQRGN